MENNVSISEWQQAIGGDEFDISSEIESLNVRWDEIEDCLDTFSVCSLMLREETRLTEQYFSDLASLCETLEDCDKVADGVNEQEQCERFRRILAAIGASTPKRLPDICGASLEDCTAVYRDPLRCNPDSRCAVVNALQKNANDKIWSATKDGKTVGELLYIWLRENFNTPYRFLRELLESRTKCNLIGAVCSLPLEKLRRIAFCDPVKLLEGACTSHAGETG